MRVVETVVFWMRWSVTAAVVAVLLLAELIVAGQTRIDVSEFSPDRFKDMDVDAYLATDLNYKAALRPYRRH